MIPEKYKWITDEPGPKMIIEALKEYGTLEVPGTGDNPKILGWAKELGISAIYSDDSVPWCGLFMGVIAARAGKIPPSGVLTLRALEWAKFGVARDNGGMFGDVLVFQRKGGGHVGLYVGESETTYHVLGGNQSDKVCFTEILKSRLFAVRSPVYTTEPENIRKIYIGATGVISTNEG